MGDRLHPASIDAAVTLLLSSVDVVDAWMLSVIDAVCLRVVLYFSGGVFGGRCYLVRATYILVFCVVIISSLHTTPAPRCLPSCRSSSR